MIVISSLNGTPILAIEAVHGILPAQSGQMFKFSLTSRVLIWDKNNSIDDVAVAG